MGVFDTIGDALSGKAAQQQGGPPLNQAQKGAAFDMSARDAMMKKLKTLGLSSMPEGGEAELDAMYSDHVRRYGAAAGSLRK